MSERLQDLGLPLVVVDLNPAVCRQARGEGCRAVIGDAQHVDVLEEAGLERARYVVLTLPQPSAVLHVVRLVRSLAPEALLLVRARYHLFRPAIEAAGAHVVVDEEEDVGRTMARAFRRLERATAAAGRAERVDVVEVS